MDEEPGYPNEIPDDEPDFIRGIPEELFAKVIKSRSFRRGLFAAGTTLPDLREFLDKKGIPITDFGLQQLRELIRDERSAKSLTPLDGDPPIDIA